jgi:hypothetical protein
MVSKRDYSAEAVEAAGSVLIELVHLLGEYRDHHLFGRDAVAKDFFRLSRVLMGKDRAREVRDNPTWFAEE